MNDEQRYIWHLRTSERQGDEYRDDFFASKEAALAAADDVASEFVGEFMNIWFEEWDSDGYVASARSISTEEAGWGSIIAKCYDQVLVRRRVFGDGEAWGAEEDA